MNGTIVAEMGAKADPEKDDIQVDGKSISQTITHVYIALNKPVGYVCTVKDPHARNTVMDLVKNITERIYPIGRLDADSAGLILLTNDGDLAHTLSHPSHQVEKTYRVLARGEVSEFGAADLRHGVMLEDGMTSPAKVEWVEYQQEHNVTVVDITIREGRNRQIRRMFSAIGYPVIALTRTKYGPIELKGIAPGTWRKLRQDELRALKS